jgi:serine protease Do
VRISGVVAGGPAALAGLEPDDVVVRWNRSPIRDALEFIRLVQETNPGTSVDLGLVRAGKQRRLQAVVATRRPDESRGVLVVTFPDVLSFPDSSVQAELSYAAPRDQRPGIGVDLYPLTPQLAGVLEIPGQAGLLVSSVQPNAPAALAGVRAGDVILSIDGRRIFDPLAFMAHIQARGWGSTLVLRYLRKKTEHVARIYLKRALGGR